MTAKQPPKPNDTENVEAAKQALFPELNAAGIVQALNVTGNPDMIELIEGLKKRTAIVNAGDLKGAERMLVSQAHALDSVFAHLSRRAALNMGQYVEAAETYMKLALRAQAQCRATLETLATIKNPPVVFAKQANIAAGHQQVNNGPLAREQIEKPQTELLGQDNERLDIGAPRAAGKRNPPLETVETIDRPAHAARKGRVEP